MTGFLASGGLATALHWSVMAGLWGLGVAPALATATGSAAGAGVNYGLQRRLAFGVASPHRRALPRYLLSCSLAWLSNVLLFAFLHSVAACPVALAQVATTALVTGLNYCLYQRFVFHESFPSVR
ncbi:MULTISPECIES: GtrA family protein [Marinobacter]|uniref:GtrA family protein n=1 Tax=Marinobacter TaxID=2742 RepID=UPI001D1792EF|nr:MULTISPECIES: GtrA family protein [Marinobacter]